MQPGPIRFGADEVTYNLHILLRFEIEHQLLNKDLTVAELPEAWNAKVKEYLDLTPANDAEGVLQDVHWSMYYMGYFPSYTLGNLYSAQIFTTAREQIGDTDAMFARGEFAPLRDWLGENVYRHGMRYQAADLVEHITGRPPSSEAFLTYLDQKYRP